MRDIKFRVWNGNKMVGGLDFTKHSQYLIQINGNIILEQFTGLQDKNGKDIYEGDILHYNTGFAGEPKSRDGIVVWKQGAFGVDNASMQLTWYTDHYGCEIIGNIHEKGKEE